MGNERRQKQRAHFGRLIQYVNDGKMYTSNVEEISECGLRLEVPWELPMHSGLTISLPLPFKGKLTRCTINGQVVRRRGHYVGVAFRNLLPRTMLQLRDYVWRSQPYY